MLAALLAPVPADATPLEQVIPSLFGGRLITTIDKTGSDVSNTQAFVVQQFTNLSAQLAAARSQVPLPSSSGAFSYAWDSDVDTFVRFEQSLGAGFGERAQTLGKGRFNVGLSYQHVDFSTLAGAPLDNIVSVQPAFSKSYLATKPAGDQAIYKDDIVRTQLDMSFTFDMFYLSAAYGLTDTIDVSIALAINHAHMQGTATAMTLDPTGNGGVSAVPYFSPDQVGRLETGPGPICGQGNRCATASFNESATGTGDVFLRAKWHVVDTWLADIALAEVLTLPTGNADELLGFHDPTFTPWFIASKSIGRVSPHLNLGYSFRSGQDVSQAQWIVGADVLTTRWLTLSGDFLGYHDDKRDGINDNVIQSAVGFKLNPWGGLVLNASFQFPLNTDGIRADVIY
ncbi:MAG TPA: hypothetical protein VL049_16990, partial [Candidatus Dormibacteraeota bacterium]|nr:hypothetical protein [Candidatus Dormibacteraeota bacterium]